jgi:hypothetical protein
MERRGEGRRARRGHARAHRDSTSATASAQDVEMVSSSDGRVTRVGVGREVGPLELAFAAGTWWMPMSKIRCSSRLAAARRRSAVSQGRRSRSEERLRRRPRAEFHGAPDGVFPEADHRGGVAIVTKWYVVSLISP